MEVLLIESTIKTATAMVTISQKVNAIFTTHTKMAACLIGYIPKTKTERIVLTVRRSLTMLQEMSQNINGGTRMVVP